jgi:hypothetical protein
LRSSVLGCGPSLSGIARWNPGNLVSEPLEDELLRSAGEDELGRMSGVASALDGDQEVLGRDPDGAAGATIEAPDEVRKRLDELRPAALRL